MNNINSRVVAIESEVGSHPFYLRVTSSFESFPSTTLKWFLLTIL